MIKKSLISILFIASLNLVVGCASRGEIETMQNQLAYLERSSSQMQKRIVVLDSLYRDALEKSVYFQADLKVALADMIDRNNIVDGRLSDIDGRLAKILNMLDARGNWRAPAQPVANSDSLADTVTAQVSSPQIDANKLFENAFADMRSGNYDLAIMQFGEFIDLFKSSQRAGEAQYWLGECYYGKKEFAKAIPEFEKVEKEFPQSDKLLSALYKLARSHEEIEQKQKAKVIYNRIIKEHPNSFEATRSEERLANF